MGNQKLYLNLERDFINIGNDLIERELVIENGTLYTKKLINKISNSNLIKGVSKEFEFKINNRTYLNKDFEYLGYETFDLFETKRLMIKLRSKDKILKVRIFYEVYRNFAVTRKWMEIVNISDKEIKISDLAWEKLSIVSKGDWDIYHNYLSQKSKSLSIAMKDCIVVAHNNKINEGFLAATEAAGILKQIELFNNNDDLSIMFNNSYQTIFEKYLSPGVVFKTPESFILLYKNEDYNNVVDNEYMCFLKNKIIKTECEKMPNVTWFSWNGEDMNFFKLSEKYIEDSIKVAKEISVDCILIDSGWFDYLGDYNVDNNKFPKGIEYLSYLIHKNNMKLGLWLALASVDINSEVLKNHKEWICRDKNGNPTMHSRTLITMCLDTDYKYYITDKMKSLIRKFEVDILKIDLTAIRNVYIPKASLGCCTEGHNHKSQNESFYNINEAMLQILNNVRSSEKHCVVNLSFESYGIPNGIDIAQLKVSHANWIVNSYTQPDYARRMMFQRSRVVPSYCISLHATDFNNKDLEYSILSNMITGVVATGNLMRLNDNKEKKDRVKYWFNWLNEYRKKNDFYRYNKVSNIFKAPNTSDPTDWEKYIKNYDSGNYYGAIALDDWTDLNEYFWRDKFTTQKEWIEWIKREKVAYIDTSNLQGVRLRVISNNWDGTAKLNEEGEGVILIFRPENNNEDYKIFKLPWILDDIDYKLENINLNKEIGIYNSKFLKSEGLKIFLNRREAVLITIEKHS